VNWEEWKKGNRNTKRKPEWADLTLLAAPSSPYIYHPFCLCLLLLLGTPGEELRSEVVAGAMIAFDGLTGNWSGNGEEQSSHLLLREPQAVSSPNRSIVITRFRTRSFY
jgi:hypothetical protein